MEDCLGFMFVGLPRFVGVDVQIEQSKSVFARGEIRELARFDMPLDVLGTVDIGDHITPWLEFPTIAGVGQVSFPILVAVVEMPVFLGDGVDDGALPILRSWVEDVNKRLESLERILCQLRNRIFWFSFGRFAFWDTIIMCSQHTII